VKFFNKSKRPIIDPNQRCCGRSQEIREQKDPIQQNEQLTLALTLPS